MRRTRQACWTLGVALVTLSNVHVSNTDDWYIGIIQFTTDGFPISTLTESGALPKAVKFTDNGNGTGTLSGSPMKGTAGNYTIAFSANNGIGATAVQNFSLTVH